MGIEVALDGRLGGAPQARVSAGGTAWVSFSLAAGGHGEETEWVSVAVFGDVAAGLPGDLNKGERVYVEGKLSVWRREGPTGAKASLSVAATRVEVLDRIGRHRRPVRGGSKAEAKRGSKDPARTLTVSAPADEASDGLIPF
jgi:single-stranded DNA-binding protein